MNIFECAVIKNMVGGGGGASEELLARIADLEARVNALEPRTQYFNIDAYEWLGSANDGLPAIVAPCSDVYVRLKDVAPDLKIGKTYTFSTNWTCYDPYLDMPSISVCGNDLYLDVSSADDNPPAYVTFTIDSEADYDLAEIRFGVTGADVWNEVWEYNEYCNFDTYYYNIMINEGTEPLPWEPYKG